MPLKLSFWVDAIFSKIPVFLISGKAGVGKDTVADYLVNTLNKKGYSVYRTSFASVIKELAKKFFFWNGEKDAKGRKLLQDLGQIGREYDENVWVKHLLNYLDDVESDCVAISDWRFPNEYATLSKDRRCECIRIRIEAESKESLKDSPAYHDISETSLPSGYGFESQDVYDFVINNDGSLEELYKQLDYMLEQLIGGKRE